MQTQSQDTGVVNPIQLQKFLGGVDYPATKDVLLDAAEQNGADEMVLSSLSMIEEKEYESPADVSKAIGEVDEEEI